MQKQELIKEVNKLFKFQDDFEKSKKKNCFLQLKSDKSKQTIVSMYREEFLDLKKKVIEMINEMQVEK